LLSRNSRRLLQTLHVFSTAVHHRAARAVLAHEKLVVLLLHARNTYHVAGIVELELRLIKHVFGDFPYVANQVSHEAALWVQAAVRHDGVELRQLITMRLHERQLVRRNVLFQEDGLVLRQPGKLFNPLAHFIGIQVQAARDQVRVGIQVAALITQQQRGKGRVVVDDNSTFPVQQLASGRENRDIANSVLFGEAGVHVTVHDLQPPQAIGQQQEPRQSCIARQ
jgi:hypothetical protein